MFSPPRQASRCIYFPNPCQKKEGSIALINCPVCGASLSEEASVCIQCGHPLYGESAHFKGQSTSYTEPCTCGNPVSWQVIHEQQSKSRAFWGNTIIVVAALFGILTLIGIGGMAADGEFDSSYQVLFALFVGGGSLYLAYKLKTTKPPVRQILRCKYCDRTIENLVPFQNF